MQRNSGNHCMHLHVSISSDALACNNRILNFKTPLDAFQKTLPHCIPKDTKIMIEASAPQSARLILDTRSHFLNGQITWRVGIYEWTWAWKHGRHGLTHAHLPQKPRTKRSRNKPCVSSCLLHIALTTCLYIMVYYSIVYYRTVYYSIFWYIRIDYNIL